MKRHIISLISILLVLVVMTGCEKARIMFSEDAVVGFGRSAVSVDENNAAGVVIELYLGAALGTPGTDITLEVSIEGHQNPAIEGEDFTISSKLVSMEVGTATVTVTPIDDDVFTGNRTFSLRIASNSKNYPVSAQNSVTVTIVDNEHPLSIVLGTYDLAGTDYWGDDVVAVIETSVVAGSLEQVKFPLIQMLGGGPEDNIVFVDVDLDAMIFSIKARSQDFPVDARTVQIAGFTADLDAIPTGSPIRATIDANGNLVMLDYIGINITAGDNTGAWFELWAPGVTWTKRGGKDDGGVDVPTMKIKTPRNIF